MLIFTERQAMFSTYRKDYCYTNITKGTTPNSIISRCSHSNKILVIEYQTLMKFDMELVYHCEIFMKIYIWLLKNYIHLTYYQKMTL